jgi:hypothetical protein
VVMNRHNMRACELATFVLTIRMYNELMHKLLYM